MYVAESNMFIIINFYNTFNMKLSLINKAFDENFCF